MKRKSTYIPTDGSPILAEAEDGTFWKTTDLEPWVKVGSSPVPIPPTPVNPEKEAFYDKLDVWCGYRDTYIKKLGLNTDAALAEIYYDGELCCWNLIDYFTALPSPRSWADNCNYTYTVYYLAGSDWKAQGFRVFGEGLAERYIRTKDPKALSDLTKLMANGAYMGPSTPPLNTVNPNPKTRHELSREWAYCILGYLELQRCTPLNQDQINRLNQCYQDSILIISDWCGKVGRPPAEQTASYGRPFMMGITMHAQINYYERVATVTQKAEIVAWATRLASYAWTWCWLEDKLTFKYTDRTGINLEDANPSPDLNMLIAPWFAWLWSVTKNPLWKERAIKIFKGSANTYFGTPEYPRGKVIDQQLVWDKYWDYIEVV